MKVFVDSGVYMDYLQGDGTRLHVLKSFGELLAQHSFKLIFPNITKEEIYRGIPMDYGRYTKNKFCKVSIPNVPAGIEDGNNYRKANDLLAQYSLVIEEVRKESLLAIDDILA